MQHPTARKKILFAEDDDAMRRFVEVILKKAGYEVVSVEDGLQAFERALAADFDAIVADAVMPNMSGFDLCRMLRGSADASRKNVPFIILSGLEQKARGAGGEKDDFAADAYLSKGSNIKEILTRTLAGIFDEKSV